MRFRAGDFWVDLAGKLNQVRERLEALEVKNNRLQLENRQLRDALQQPSSEAPDEGATTEAESLL